MKLISCIFLAIAAISITACGGSTVATKPVAKVTNPTEQVRQTYSKVLTAMTSKHPENMCRYYRPKNNSDCLSAIMMLKATKTSPASLVPHDWQQRLAKAKIVVHGNTGTIVSGVASEKGGSKFTRINGRWYKNGE